MNAWQEYKKKLGTTRPWDLLNPNVEYATETIQTSVWLLIGDLSAS